MFLETGHQTVLPAVFVQACSAAVAPEQRRQDGQEEAFLLGWRCEKEKSECVQGKRIPLLMIWWLISIVSSFIKVLIFFFQVGGSKPEEKRRNSGKKKRKKITIIDSGVVTVLMQQTIHFFVTLNIYTCYLPALLKLGNYQIKCFKPMSMSCL